MRFSNEVPSGKTATLKAVAKAADTTDLTYKWYRYKDGDLTQLSATGASLTTGAIKENREYECVVMDRYETGLQLLQAGVSGGYDSTIECTVTKLMVLFGDGYDARQVRQRMCCSLAGEISVAGEN